MERVKPLAGEGRLASLDALRGFNMFWIIGGIEILRCSLRLFCDPLPCAVAHQFEHSEWVGMTAWDLIMPLFLFVAGVSMPFSLGKRQEASDGLRGVYVHLLKRTALLYLLGMVVGGNLLFFDPGRLYLFSNTLQAIACGCLVANVVLLHLRVCGQVLACAVLLAAYGLVLCLVPFPGHAAGTLAPEANLARFVDHALFGRFVDGTTYAWVLCIPAFGATVLLGALGGEVLRAPWTPGRRMAVLIGAGLAGLVLGEGTGWLVPIIKRVWSPSFALFAGGWSFLILAFFHGVVDILGWRRWTFPFTVIGTNALFIYVLSQGIGEYATRSAQDSFFALPAIKGLTVSVGAVIFFWTILYVLYRKRIFIKL